MCSLLTSSPSVLPAAVTPKFAFSLPQLLRTPPKRWQMEVSNHDCHIVNHDVNLLSSAVNLIRLKCCMRILNDLCQPISTSSITKIMYQGQVARWPHKPWCEVNFYSSYVNTGWFKCQLRVRLYDNQVCPRLSQASFSQRKKLCLYDLCIVKCQLLFVNIVRFGCNLGYWVTLSGQSFDPSCTQIGQFYLVFFLALR